MTTLFSQLASAFSLGSATSPLDGAAAYSAFENVFQGGAPWINSSIWDPMAPKAYLNYLLFDENFVLVDAGFDQVSTDCEQESDLNPVAPHDYLSLHVKVEQKGYLYVYLSNEQPTLTNVYFDDMKIVQYSAVEQVNDYYPFGLTFNPYQRENTVPNKYLFNKGSELQTDLSLNLYFTPFRLYDPAIGRFTQIDPMADFFTGINPYSFAFDNPVLFGDPDGLGPIDWLKRLFRGHIGDGASKQARRSQRNNHATGVIRGPRSKGSQNSNNSSSTPQPQVLIALGSGPTRQEKPEEPPVKRDDPKPPKIEIDRVLTGDPVTYTEVIEFKGGKDEIENQYTAGEQLKELVDILKKHPEISVFIHGNAGDGELPGNKFLLTINLFLLKN